MHFIVLHCMRVCELHNFPTRACVSARKLKMQAVMQIRYGKCVEWKIIYSTPILSTVTNKEVLFLLNSKGTARKVLEC